MTVQVVASPSATVQVQTIASQIVEVSGGTQGPPGEQGSPGVQGNPGPAGTLTYIGSNAYDSAMLAAVRIGDLFMYNDGGDHPGWMYRWNGTDWDYAANLKGPTGASGSAGIVTGVPATVAAALATGESRIVLDSSGALSLVTGA